MDCVERAAEIAREAHARQYEKTGLPFIEHCRRVADAVTGSDAKTVAWLHDVIEKGAGWPEERLAAEGFRREILSAVDAMTRRAGEPYGDFVRRSCSNTLALHVKRADLEDNARQCLMIGQSAEKYDYGLSIASTFGGVGRP